MEEILDGAVVRAAFAPVMGLRGEKETLVCLPLLGCSSQMDTQQVFFRLPAGRVLRF